MRRQPPLLHRHLHADRRRTRTAVARAAHRELERVGAGEAGLRTVPDGIALADRRTAVVWRRADLDRADGAGTARHARDRAGLAAPCRDRGHGAAAEIG